MGTLTLRLMGRFEAILPGQAVAQFESNKVKALLAFLAAEPNQVHSREALAEMLWPGLPQTSAATNFRHILSSLRKTIGDRLARPPFLWITRETVQINRSSSLQVDQWDFEKAFNQSPDAGQKQPSTLHLASICDLYHGPFLDGLDCHSEPFDRWVQVYRAGNHSKITKSLLDLASLYASAGSCAASIQIAQRLLAMEPWQETAHRLVMSGLARQGERAAALAQYELCCQILKNELNLEPEPETTRLAGEIRTGRLGSDDTSASDLLPRHNLPASKFRLIGREPELAKVDELLKDPACRLLSLAGPGGIGKTHMALEAAGRQIDRFFDGVFFVSLAPVQSADRIAPAIAQALGFSISQGVDPVQALLEYLRKKELLLILDNFEHLLDGASQVQSTELVLTTLQSAPRLKIVVTSRTRLNLQIEHVLRVDGLEYLARAAKPLDAIASIQLFLAGARRVQPRYEAAPGELEFIGQICRRLQGLPLAILLAAGWIEVLSPPEILKEIEHRSLDFLESDWQDLSERQRSIRATFDVSYRLLSSRSQAIFAALSVFRGGVTLQTAQQVSGVTLQEIRALIDKCMLQRAADGRFYLHELLRVYAQERLAQSSELHWSTHDRHAACFSAALAGWWTDFRSQRQFAAIEEFGVEVENALSAWNWMAEQMQVERMSQALMGLLYGLSYAYGDKMGADTGRSLCLKTAQALAPQVLPDPAAFPAGARLLVKLWVSQPSLLFQIPDQLGVHLQQSEQILKRLEDTQEDIRAEKIMLLLRKGDLSIETDMAVDYQSLYRECLSLARDLDDPWLLANTLYGWGFSSCLYGYLPEALEMLNECLAIYLKLGDRINRGVAMSLTRVVIARMGGDFSDFERLVREHLAFCEASGNARLTALAKGELGNLELAMGNHAEGAALLEECFTALDHIGAASEASFYGLMLSIAQNDMGQWEPAFTRCKAILSYYRRSGQLQFLGGTLSTLGFSALALEKYPEARQHLEEAARVQPKSRSTDRGLSLAWLGYAERCLGQDSQAVTTLIQALNAIFENQVNQSHLMVLPAAAVLLADQGEIELALEVYALARQESSIANSAFYETVAGRALAERSAGLGAATIAAIQARGRERDLQATLEQLLHHFQMQISR